MIDSVSAIVRDSEDKYHYVVASRTSANEGIIRFVNIETHVENIHTLNYPIPTNEALNDILLFCDITDTEPDEFLHFLGYDPSKLDPIGY